VLTDIRSDVARLRQSLGKPEGNSRLERGAVYFLKVVPDGARTVYDFFRRTGQWFEARERLASGPDDHGRMVGSNSSFPDIEREVEAAGELYEMRMSAGCIFLPKGSDPDAIQLPPGIQFGHVEHTVKPPEYFLHHLEVKP